MTYQADLAAIKARCEAASEGPWSVMGDEIVGPLQRHVLEGYYAHHEVEVVADDPNCERRNFTFISAARTDVPRQNRMIQALITELRELLADRGWDDDKIEGFIQGLWDEAGK